MWQSCHCGEGHYVGVCGTVSVVRCRTTGKLATWQRISNAFPKTARELGHELWVALVQRHSVRSLSCAKAVVVVVVGAVACVGWSCLW